MFCLKFTVVFLSDTLYALYKTMNLNSIGSNSSDRLEFLLYKQCRYSVATGKVSFFRRCMIGHSAFSNHQMEFNFHLGNGWVHLVTHLIVIN